MPLPLILATSFAHTRVYLKNVIHWKYNLKNLSGLQSKFGITEFVSVIHHYYFSLFLLKFHKISEKLLKALNLTWIKNHILIHWCDNTFCSKIEFQRIFPRWVPAKYSNYCLIHNFHKAKMVFNRENHFNNYKTLKKGAFHGIKMMT